MTGFCIFILFVAQSGLDQTRLDFQAHRFEPALASCERFIRRHPKDPALGEALYLRALLEPNPDSSLRIFRRTIARFPGTEWAERSQFAAGKIEYGLDRFAEAASAFEKFNAGYPRSPSQPEALYWLGCAERALGDTASARRHLTELATTYPGNSWTVRTGVIIPPTPSVAEIPPVTTGAPVDAGTSAATPAAVASVPKPFTIQVGSFQSRTNAETLVGQLARLGLTGEIHRAVVQSKTFFRVWVGSFAGSDEAQATLQTLKNHGITGSLVKR